MPRFHFLAENLVIILSTLLPFSIYRAIINKRFLVIKGAILIAYTQVTSLMACCYFQSINKEYQLDIFLLIGWQQSLLCILMQTSQP